MTTSALRSPFDTTIDAILHYYPLTSPDTTTPDHPHPHPRSETDTETETQPHSPNNLSSSISLSPTVSGTAYTCTRPRPQTRPISPLYTSTTSASLGSALPLPAPYRPPLVPPQQSYFPSRPTSRFIGTNTIQIQAPVPQRPGPGIPTFASSPNQSPRRNNMDSSSLLSPRANSRGGGGASPSRTPHHLNALSPLQSFSPLQPSSMPKLAPAVSNTASVGSVPDSATSDSRRLVKSMSRKQSMYASAAQWEKGQWERENENTPMGGLFSKITLVRAPDQDSGLKK